MLLRGQPTVGHLYHPKAATMVEDSATSCTSLLDLPDDLLAKCLPGDWDSCIKVYRTSRKLLLLGLEGTATGTLSYKASTQEPQAASIRLLSKRFPNFHKLTVQCDGRQRSRNNELLQTFFSTPSGMEPGTAWLRNITEMTICHKRPGCAWPIETLLPSTAALACPSLKHVTIESLVSRIRQGSEPVHLPQLQRLNMRIHAELSDQEAFHQQLQALPSLQYLSCTIYACKSTSRAARVCTAIANAVSHQLSQLHMYLWYLGISTVPETALLSLAYPMLHHLRLVNVEVTDSIMELLLQHAPQLHSISVFRFSLQSNFSSRQCSWKTVHETRDGVDVRSLALLPLSSVTFIEVSCVTHLHLVHTGQGITEDLRLTAAAVKAVQGCGGLRDKNGLGFRACIWALRQGTDLARNGQVLLASVPLLHGAFRLDINNTHISQELVAAIGQLPSCTRVEFGRACTFDMDIWPHVLPLLHKVRELDICSDGITPTIIEAMCSAATHPLTLMLDSRNADFHHDRHAWAQQVSTASNNLVTVQCT